MTLTTRLTAFTLAGLALTLFAFSLSVFLLVRERLYAEADARLIASLDTLTAAAEIDERGVEWEPGERLVVLDHGSSGGAVCWSAVAPDNRVLESTKSVQAVPPGLDESRLAHRHPFTQPNVRGENWRVFHKRIEATQGYSPPRIRDREDDQHERFASLDLIVAVPLEPVETALSELAMILAGVSTAVWLAGFAGSRWVCRRALRPVTQMAQQAHAMSAVDLGERLAVPPTGDELAALGTSFNGLLARVEVAYERQERFAGDASHQLRTPLAALLGQVEVALRQPRSAEEYRETLEKVRGRGDHLRQIVESLLFLTRTDSEAWPASLESVELGEWVSDYFAAWSSPSNTTFVKYRKIGDGFHRAKIHPVLFGQLLDNLFDNAIKYSPADSPVMVLVQTEDEWVHVVVEDRGTGIAAADLPRLFDPFFRTDETRRSGLAGVGLGLAIARRIAVAHGGTILATSEPGHGSRFGVVLPRHDR